MSPAVIVALTPLWFGLVGAVFVLTVGRRIAQRERQVRLQLEKEEEQRILVESDQLANFRLALRGMSIPWPGFVSGGTGMVYPAGLIGSGLVYAQTGITFASGSQMTTESTKPEQQTDLEKQSRPPLAA